MLMLLSYYASYGGLWRVGGLMKYARDGIGDEGSSGGAYESQYGSTFRSQITTILLINLYR